MKNRELVMLADTYNAAKHRSAGMYLSEKMDGMRALWIPMTRGRRVSEIPFANMDKDIRDHVATGLWSRYGKPIFAPEWFLTGFPPYPLDGELWAGRGKFQELMSAVKKLEPVEAEWLKVKYHVFDAPLYKSVFMDGKVSSPNYKKQIRLDEHLLSLAFLSESIEQPMFDVCYKVLNRDLQRTSTLVLHEQILLPFHTERALTRIAEELEKVTDGGGEGLILRHPASAWEPYRSRFLLKIKKLHDAEGLVLGYRAGQGKYLGMLGSLTVKWEHGTFELSGFTDAERQLTAEAARAAIDRPGEMLTGICSMQYPLQSVVTFRYRELTVDKAPKEARFHRKFIA